MAALWRNAFDHEKNNKLLAASACFLILAIAIYFSFFDILIPGLPDGSYRLAIGDLFFIPSVLLAIGQTFIPGFTLHASTALFNAKKDFLKAIFISSLLTFLFSLTYVIFPFYGPFYYIVFAVGGPWYALPVEILWSAITVSTGALLIRKFYGLNLKISYAISLLVVAGIVVAAS